MSDLMVFAVFNIIREFTWKKWLLGMKSMSIFEYNASALIERNGWHIKKDK